MEKVINVKDFSFCYGVKKVLNNINISIKEGEIIGLLGENGAGKTTLLNCIYGILGKFDEINVLSTTPCIDNEIIKTNISYIEDTPNLLDYLTADQYLHFICKIEDIDFNNIKNEINTLILKFNLEMDYSNKLLKDYSFGMKKKIHFIGNLIQKKKIILIDEPTNGLDIGMVILLKKLIKEKSVKEHTTMLISSHNTGFLKDICDRVLLFNKGEIIKDICIDEQTNLELEFLKMKGEEHE